MKKIKKFKNSILGIDLANDSTGLSIFDLAGNHLYTEVNCFSKLQKKERDKRINECIAISPKRKIDTARWKYHEEKIIEIIKRFQVNFVSIEGYAFSQRSRAATKLPEIGGIIKRKLDRLRIPWIEVTPTQLKKFATGKGICPKEIVILEVYKRYKIDFPEVISSGKGDAADSFIVGLIGWHFRNNNLKGLTKFQIEVIKKINESLEEEKKKNKKK